MSLSSVYKEFKVNSKGKKVIVYPQLISDENIAEESRLDINTLSSEFDDDTEQINNMKEEAKRIVQEANQQAEEMILEKKQEIDTWWEQKRLEDKQITEDIKKKGYELGYVEGKESAEKELNQQYQSILEQANSILKEAYEAKEQIIQDSEPIIIDLSMKIAEKIIKKELDSDVEIIKNITVEALKNVKEFEKISIYVNPNDFIYLNGEREELLKNLNGQVDLMVYPDSSILNNGCIIKTTTGTLDARIDTQLEQIKHLLVELAGRC